MVALAFGRMTVAVGVALLTLTACSTRTEDRLAAAECAPENQRYCAAAVGDLLDVTLADLRPTQPSLGYDEVYYRLGRYTLGEGAADQLLDQWCVTNGQQGLASATPGATISDPASFTCAVAVGAETDESRIPMKTGHRSGWTALPDRWPPHADLVLGGARRRPGHPDTAEGHRESVVVGAGRVLVGDGRARLDLAAGCRR